MSEHNDGLLRIISRPLQPLVIRDESVTVSFAGDLNAGSAPAMRLHLLSLVCEDGPSEIIVDLSGVDWIDHDGVAPLVEALRLQASRRSVLRLTRLSRPVSRFLRSEARLARMFAPHINAGGRSHVVGEADFTPDEWRSDLPTWVLDELAAVLWDSDGQERNAPFPKAVEGPITPD